MKKTLALTMAAVLAAGSLAGCGLSLIHIFSSQNERIAGEIMKQLDRGATFLKSQGAYSKIEGNALMCVVDRKQFYIVKRIIDHYDPRAFVIVSETKEVYGEGFLNDPRERSAGEQARL